MGNPLISVIVPVYKVEAYLERCVNSIRNQSYTNLEIILVDDGSPDRCGAMCDAMAFEDPRIRVVHKQNGGLSSARNAGLDIMTGDYVGFVDSDDWILPQMYETLYHRLLQERAQISCCGIARHDGEAVLSYFCSDLQTRFTLSREESMIELGRNYRVTNSVCDKLYQSDLFHELRMKVGILYEDSQIQPYLLHRAQRITYTAEPLYIYFQSQNSILRGKISAKHYDCIEAMKERIGFFQKYYPSAVASAQAEYLELCLHFIYQSRGNDQWGDLRTDMIRSVRQPVSKEIFRCLSRKTRLKRSLLCVNEALYIRIIDLYIKRKRR